jgi:hypothetical protein
MTKKNKPPVVESPVEQKPWEAGRPTGVYFDAKKARDDPWFLDDEPPRRPATAFNIAAAINEARREGVRKKDSKGGKKSAEVQAPKVRARHDLVLDLMHEIEAANPALPKEDIATKIEPRLLANGNPLGRGQILRIMRGPKKRSTG